jgi:hypothetical protein
VRDILRSHEQEDLLDDIISTPLALPRRSKRKSEYAIDESREINEETINNDNSVKLIRDLEAILPLVNKSITLIQMNRDTVTDQLR